MRISLNPFRANGRKPREDAELNLIPMIDIMSVMVAFLLMYSTEVEVVPNAKDVSVPISTAEVKPSASVVVMITQDALFVQNEEIATMAEINDPNQAFIGGLYNLLTQPTGEQSDAQLAEELQKKEITVLADSHLPYSVIRKVMTTCTKANYGKLSLAVLEKSGGNAAPSGG